MFLLLEVLQCEVGRLIARCPVLELLDVSNNNAGPEGLRGDFCEALDDARPSS